jgi:hypothetical protein
MYLLSKLKNIPISKKIMVGGGAFKDNMSKSPWLQNMK